MNEHGHVSRFQLHGTVVNTVAQWHSYTATAAASSLRVEGPLIMTPPCTHLRQQTPLPTFKRSWLMFARVFVCCTRWQHVRP